MDRTIIEKAYACIGNETPLDTDCGKLCFGACCQPDEDGQGGVYVFPGEETVWEGESWAKVTDMGRFAPVMTCPGTCDREKRPLGCRIFPLTPVLGEKGWTVRIDARARAMCPLVRSGLKGLKKDFVRAVRKAVLVISEDPEGEAFLRKWQEEEDAFRENPFGL